MKTIPTSKKEQILDIIEQKMHGIKRKNIAYDDVHYNNDTGYVDRQYINITPEDIQKNGVNWIIINENNHEWNPLVGGQFENKLSIEIVAFTQVLNKKENLSTKMNSLQKDISVAILKDVELNNMCSYIVPISDSPVTDMIYPYGGILLRFDIIYVTQSKLDF